MADIQFTAYLPKALQPKPLFNNVEEEQQEENNVQEQQVPITLSGLPHYEQQLFGTFSPKIVKGITDNSGKYNIGNMQHVINAFEDAGISVRITSGYRPGAKTKSGNNSHHAFGNAIDITPNFSNGETWDSLRRKLKESPILIQYLKDNKIGILDETTAEALRKTGGTGAHWHVGPDTNAIKGLDILLSKQGGILKAQAGIYFPNNNISLIEREPEPYQKQYFLDSDELKFQKWYRAVAQANGLSPNSDDPEHHYDWRGYFKDHDNAVEEISGHFPDEYKLPGHETFSIESKYYKPGMMAGHWEEDEFVPTPFSEDEMEARQHWAESRFKNIATSGAGAKGPFQIMKATWDEIVKRNGLQNMDINNYNDNKKVRDIYMRNLLRYPSIAKAKEPIRTAMLYAAYNMGPGNLNKFIEKEASKGIDVYENWDWIDDLNPETKNYVNFIVRGVDGSADLTNSAFNKALPNRFNK